MAEKPGPIPSPGTWTIVTRPARGKEKEGKRPDNGLGQFNPDIKNNPFDSVGALGASPRWKFANRHGNFPLSLRRPPPLLCHRLQFRFNPRAGYYTGMPQTYFSVADWETRRLLSRGILTQNGIQLRCLYIYYSIFNQIARNVYSSYIVMY